MKDISKRITMSSRVRLARNFADMFFPGRMKTEQSLELLRRARDAFFRSPGIDRDEYIYVDMQGLDTIDKMMLVEQRLVSPDLVVGGRPSAAILKRDETLSVMLNEEDHLRIQCVLPSDDIDAAYSACSRVERVFDSRFEIAFDQDFGFLTSCPTNLGTGMRASFMLHLPALSMTGHIKNILEACGKIGVAVRGIYGENSEASGSLYQFSNQGSLGRAEEEIIESIKGVRTQIVGHEAMLREGLFKQGRTQLEDRVCRALGTLRYARSLASEECMRLWSDVRLGVDMGVIADVDVGRLDRMATKTQPAYIQKTYGRMLNSEERDVQRARIAREQLAPAAAPGTGE